MNDIEVFEKEMAEAEEQYRNYKPKHLRCGGACHKCPDLNGDIMPGCYGGMYNLEGCYCRPDKMVVAHPKCPSCRCQVEKA